MCQFCVLLLSGTFTVTASRSSGYEKHLVKMKHANRSKQETVAGLQVQIPKFTVCVVSGNVIHFKSVMTRPFNVDPTLLPNLVEGPCVNKTKILQPC